MALINVILAGDRLTSHGTFRAKLGNDFRVVAEASNAPKALALVRKLRPHLVVCEMDLPNGGGFEVVNKCCDISPIVLIADSEVVENDLLEAVAIGALGYITEPMSPDDTCMALKRAARWEPVVSPTLATYVLTEFRRARSSPGSTKPLSKRERGILQLVAQGNVYSAIATRFYISERAVENHIRNVLAKLHLNRQQESLHCIMNKRVI